VTDTVNVGPGERYEVVWEARQPGKWLLALVGSSPALFLGLDGLAARRTRAGRGQGSGGRRWARPELHHRGGGRAHVVAVFGMAYIAAPSRPAVLFELSGIAFAGGAAAALPRLGPVCTRLKPLVRSSDPARES
jgi:hypothetical protein